ncbi:MAG: T9SS type A sorting domain-containing protein [Bacteroidia bacterium]|jgi:hypothetical protein|nr:T9SS type A sorting domain-containing protein [Bacteroidia bacterium]
MIFFKFYLNAAFFKQRMQNLTFCHAVFSLILFLTIGLRAQNVPPQSSLLNYSLSTGIDRNNPNGFTHYPIGTIDPFWTCNSGPTRVITEPGGCSWSQGFNSNNSAPGSWIAPASALCSGGSSGYIGCLTNQTYVYETTFTIPLNVVFRINWSMWASDWIEEIFVNGKIAYKRNASFFSNPIPLHSNIGGINFQWCKDWNYGGLNKISVVVNSAGNQSPYCQYTGLKVTSWDDPRYPLILGNTIVCPGSTNIYTMATIASLSLTTPPTYNYAWQLPSGGWGGPNSTTNTLSVIAGTNSGIIYTYINTPHTSTYVNCVAVAGISVTVPPPLTVTPSHTTICSGSCLTISALGATNYSWYAPPNNTPPFLVGSPNANVCPLVNTTYTVKGITPLGNCIYTRTVQVVVMPKPSASIVVAPSNSIVCLGHNASLFASSNTGNVTYFWMPIWAMGSVVSVTPTQNTNYTLIVQAPNGCTNSAVASLTTVPTPTISVVAQPSVICQGSSSTLTASGGNTYLWSFNFSQQPTVVVSPTQAGNSVYQVTGYGANNCWQTKTVQVTILNSPTVIAMPPVICTGIQNTLTASGASSYTWYVGTGTNQVIYTNTSAITLNLASATPYTVCGSAPQSGTCIACYTNVIPMGNPIPLIAPNVTLCTNAGPCAPIAVTSTLNAPFTVSWSPGVLPPTSSLIVCPTVNTTYSVNVFPTGTLGCPNSATLAVTIETNCCSQPTVGMIALNPTLGLGGNHFNNSYVLGGNITLTASTSFSNAEVWMMPNVQITVPSGMFLELDKVHLFSCGLNMWKGIVVQDGGRIKTAPNHPLSYSSLIEDAEIAIDLSNITVTNSSPNPPINLQGVIFNRNFIGIRIINSTATLDSLALGINGCVFSSRTMTYTTFQNLPLNWPNSSTNCTAGGLRCAVNPTSGLTPPYTLQGFAQSFLKQPHQSQPGHIGIQIEKFGDPAGIHSKPGVQFGITYPGPFPTDFNLFDGLGCGIEITDASLTTMNNVFQNMKRYNYPTNTNFTYGGQGISQVIQPNTLMNARLYLTQNGAPGNQFWNCITGIYAFNVYDFWTRNCLFRSDHNIAMLNNFQPTVGDTGISLTTNRFNFTAIESQFNNLRYGIVVSTPTDNLNYDVTGSGPILGILMNSFTIERNYFGPLVTSNTPYSGGGANSGPSEYMEEAIRLQSPNTLGWATHPTQFGTSFVISNKIDRVYRGISLDGFEDTKLWIMANDIFIEDDFTFGQPAFGYGIGTINHTDNLAIINNTLNAQPWFVLAPNNPTVSLVYCKDNFGSNSPRIECNATSNSYYGFQFDGRSPGTIWEGNEMCTHFAGMALTNSAVIGPQGSTLTGQGSGNVWLINGICQPWGAIGLANNQTYVEDSDPTLSPLYVFNSPDRDPQNNGSNSPLVQFYMPGVTIDNNAPVNRLADCVPQHGALPPPNWRIKGFQPNNELLHLQKIDQILIYPNPTNSWLNVKNLSGEKLNQIKMLDMNGKIVFNREAINLTETSIDVSVLPASVYAIEFTLFDGSLVYKKLVKSN